MKYVLSSFGISNPYIQADIPDHAVYPIGLEGDDFIDLDYSLLMAGTAFLLDKRALEYLKGERSRLPFLLPMIRSIERLNQEGFLEYFDAGKIIAENLGQIQEKTERLCEDILGWLGPVRSQWNVLKADREAFLKKFGTIEKRQINQHHFSVTNAVLRIDGHLNKTLLDEITALINSQRMRFTRTETDYVREVLRPLVCHIVIQDLIRYRTGASILDWDDSEPYYERLYAARWERDEGRLLAHQAGSLFTVALPELYPKNVDAVIRFIRTDRNVKGLRLDVAAILASGEKVDSNLGKRLVAEVLKSELAAKGRMRKVRLLGAGLSILVPGGSLLTEGAVELGAMAVEDATEAGMTRTHRWLYALTDGSSTTPEEAIAKDKRKWWCFWK